MLQLLVLEPPHSVRDFEKVHSAPLLHWITIALAALCCFTVRERPVASGKAKAVLSVVILPRAYLNKLRNTHICQPCSQPAHEDSGIKMTVLPVPLMAYCLRPYQIPSTVPGPRAKEESQGHCRVWPAGGQLV